MECRRFPVYAIRLPGDWCGEYKKPVPRFARPSKEEVVEQVAAKSMDVDGEAFWLFYESKDWMVGKNKMKSWKSALAGWNNREPGKTDSVSEFFEK